MNKVIWFSLVVLLFSCAKSEGEGGNSSIYGNVKLIMHNSTFTVELYEDVAADYDVYIVYGDDLGFSDKVTTDYKGNYEFPYLRKGDYTVYVYSKIDTPEAINGEAPDEEALVKTVTLDKKEDLEMDDFIVLDN